jgi:hypothetical protein
LEKNLILLYAPFWGVLSRVSVIKKINVEAQIAYFEKGINFFRTKNHPVAEKCPKG